MNFTDQRVVVTGAASGIGAETARVLAADGAHVISVDRNPASGAHIAQHIACDLTDRASIDAAVAAIDGPIDALCNVAGVPGNLPSQTVFAVNFLGLRHLTEALADQITDGGAIVNVASIAGNKWQTNLTEVKLLLATPSFEDGVAWTNDNSMTGTRSYNFSKEAVIVWTMAASQRWWSRGIRLNSVSPGAIETPILVDFRESMGDEAIDWAINAIGRCRTSVRHRAGCCVPRQPSHAVDQWHQPHRRRRPDGRRHRRRVRLTLCAEPTRRRSHRILPVGHFR